MKVNSVGISEKGIFLTTCGNRAHSAFYVPTSCWRHTGNEVGHHTYGIKSGSGLVSLHFA